MINGQEDTPSDPKSQDKENDRFPSTRPMDLWTELLPKEELGGSVSADDDRIVGTTIENFVVESVLGEGGFGRVYKAHDIKLGRTVALKFLTRTFHSRSVDLFKREAKALAALSKHANIVTIYSWGEYHNSFYIALEYVPTDLSKLIDRCPQGVPLSQALDLAEQCSDAIAFAHSHGILHRDIKPQNILLDQADRVAKIADFGLTSILGAADKSVTREAMGTPPYMSPEQANEQGADGRSDVFSLGVTLYEMLCGDRPFGGGSAREIMERVRRCEYVPLRKRSRDIPPSVAAIVERAMNRDPEQRFPGAADMRDAIREARQKLDINARPPTTLPRHQTVDVKVVFARHRKLFAGIAAAAALTLVTGMLALMPGMVSEALAEGNDALEDARFQEAEEAFRDVLETNPGAAEAYYGLGYALLYQGKIDEAREAFGEIENRRWREEGLLAVARAAGEELTEPDLNLATAYAKLLWALSGANETSLRDTLRNLKSRGKDDFLFRWQYDELLQALGRTLLAYDAAGNAFPSEAMSFLQTLQESRWPRRKQFANSYMELANMRILVEQNDRRSDLLEEIRQLQAQDEQKTASGTEADPFDGWTSRPVTFYIMPSKLVPSRMGYPGVRGQELAYDFPEYLTDELAGAGFIPVENQRLIRILEEHQLALSQDSVTRNLELGRLMGARFIVQCAFETRPGGQESVRAYISSTESRRALRPDTVELPFNPDPGLIAAKLKDEILAEFRDKYRLQGKLAKRADGSVFINVGEEAGVTLSDTFRISPEPNESFEVEGLRVIVEKVFLKESAVSITPTGAEANELIEQLGRDDKTFYVFKPEPKSQS
jgi:tetratricopeptide (TPR) repeat protein